MKILLCSPADLGLGKINYVGFQGSLSPEIHKARVVQGITCFENLRLFCLKMFGLKSTGLPVLTYCHIVSTLSIEFSRFSWLIILRHLHIQFIPVLAFV